MKAVKLPRKLKKKTKRILSKRLMYHNGKAFYPPIKKLKIMEFFGDGCIIEIID